MDGAVIAAAERLGATTLYTEDLNHRQHCGSVQAINPFLQESTDSVHEGSDSRYG